MKAIVMNGTGGHEMLEHIDRPGPVAGPGQALIEVVFAGVNFMDIGVRQGVAWAETPNPKILGVEGVGRVMSPIGTKGIGALSVVGMAAAIANAVYHATGTRVRTLPISIERVLGRESSC